MMKEWNESLKVSILFILSFLFCNKYDAFAQNNTVVKKVNHAEPLYDDLVRDLGARKGEKEFDIASEYNNYKNYSEFGLLTEYEWAPANHLGMEVEADFSFYKKKNEYTAPSSRLETIHFATQYTALVDTVNKLSIAIGYAHILSFHSFTHLSEGKIIKAQGYNPFFIIAKVWKRRWHTLLYTGPIFNDPIGHEHAALSWQINSSLIYTFPKKGHFVGLEINKEWNGDGWHFYFHPQAKYRFNKHMALGIVMGYPLSKNDGKWSFFTRLVYGL